MVKKPLFVAGSISVLAVAVLVFLGVLSQRS